MNREKLYERVPGFVKKMLFYIPKGFLFGKDYYKYLKLIKNTENYSDLNIRQKN